MKVIADCCICKEHKEVQETIKNNNDEHQLVHMCDDCLKWLYDDFRKEYVDRSLM